MDSILFIIDTIQDACLKVKVQAKSQVASAFSNITVTMQSLEELKQAIHDFLQEYDLETYWESDIPGLGTTPCATIRFIPGNMPSQVLVDLYLELDDGGDFSRHTCSFYIHCTRVHLKQFLDLLSCQEMYKIGSRFVLGNA